MEELSMDFDGAIIQIQKVERNKTIGCGGCSLLKNCDYRKNLMLSVRGKSLVSSMISLSILNYSDKIWSKYYDSWTLIDENGYSYGNEKIECDLTQKRRYQSGSFITVQPKSRALASLYFPELEDGVGIAALIISNSNHSSRIEIAPISKEAQDLFSSYSMDRDTHVNAGTAPFSSPPRMLGYDQKDYKLESNIRALERIVLRLELQCHARMHNTLVPQEQVRLENEISNLMFSAKQYLQSIPDEAAPDILSRLQCVAEEYNQFIEKETSAKKCANEIRLKLDGLDKLDGRGFEEWVADLFRALGFETAVTPYAHDHGIDMVCEKDGDITAVQCKRYSGIVSAPEVQKFIGALQNAGIKRGYLVTTGIFSIGAEKAASGTGIVLCDKSGIQKLIDLASGIEPEYQTTLF